MCNIAITGATFSVTNFDSSVILMGSKYFVMHILNDSSHILGSTGVPVV